MIGQKYEIFWHNRCRIALFSKKIKQRKVFKNIKRSVYLVEMTLCGVRISKNNIIKIPLLLFVSNNYLNLFKNHTAKVLVLQ